MINQSPQFARGYWPNDFFNNNHSNKGEHSQSKIFVQGSPNNLDVYNWPGKIKELLCPPNNKKKFKVQTKLVP